MHNDPLREQLKQLREDGYCVLRRAASADFVQPVLEQIEKRKEALIRAKVARMDLVLASGFFPIWNASPLWRTRELYKLRRPFEVAYGKSDLWVSLDRCGYKRPGIEEGKWLPIHWDDDPSRHDFSPIQGVLALTRSYAGEGEFFCIPEAYRLYRDAGKDKAIPALNEDRRNRVMVEMDAGDFLLFDYRLAHGTARNNGKSIRAVQYICYVPKGSQRERSRRERCWKFGAWRGRHYFPAYSVPDEQSPLLSDVGRRLLVGSNVG